jgi:signal transduction histidine kinase/DNA-binding response OmpR family regulator
MAAPKPDNEVSRLAALADYDILDTASEKIFDSITLLASQICNVPISMIVFVDQDRQWFKSTHGIPEDLSDVTETPRDIAFCAHTILSSHLMEIPDLTQDERFKDNPFVVGYPNIRFYAGIPLAADTGENLGTLCVLDAKPNSLTNEQKYALKNLSQIVISVLNARRNLMEIELIGKIVQGTDSKIYLYDSDLNCIYTNQWYFQNLTENNFRFPEYTLQKILPLINQEELLLAVKALFNKEKNILVFETQLMREDGKAYDAEVRLQVNCGKKMQILILVLHDISERKLVQSLQLEVVKQKTKSELETSAAKTQFLAAMSHEIRTPLNGIIGITALLNNSELTEKQKEYVRLIETSGEILLSVINNILDLSKIEAQQIELESLDFNLHNLIDDLIEMFAIKAHQKGLSLWADISVNIPQWIKGDYARLQQVLNHLIGNALKFTEHGEIIIKINLVDIEPQKLTLEFIVTDTGIGIAKESIPLVFKSFSQANASITRKYGGTALGLAIAKELVELMGGKIFVTSEINHGSTFSFTVAFEISKENASDKNQPHLNSSEKNLKILCLDRSLENQVTIQRPLQAAKIQCDLASNSEEAIEILRLSAKHQKPYRVIIIDIEKDKANTRLLMSAIRENQDFGKLAIILIKKLGLQIISKDFLANDVTVMARPIRMKKLELCLEMALTNDGRKNKSTYDDSTKKARILIVEDDAVSRKVLLGILSHLGYQVLDEASNGLEAVFMAKAKSYDLIFMDCNMPKMDGYQASTVIKSHLGKLGKFTPIVAITANSASADRQKCLSSGMDDYITKPINIRLILSIVEKWTHEIL